MRTDWAGMMQLEMGVRCLIVEVLTGRDTGDEMSHEDQNLMLSWVSS